MRDFAQNLGITLIGNDIPLPTAALGGVLDKVDPDKFVNSLAKKANLDKQKVYFRNRIVQTINSQLMTEGNSELVTKISKIFSSILLSNPDHIINKTGINTDGVYIQNIVNSLDDQQNLPWPVRLYARNPHETNYGPKSSVVFDAFKVLKSFNSLNVGDNFGPDLEEFSIASTDNINAVGNGKMLLIALDQYTNERAGIGYSKFSNLPLATKYILVKEND